MLVLNGESMDVKEISLPVSATNNLAPDLILSEDTAFMSQSNLVLEDIPFEELAPNVAPRVTGVPILLLI